MTQEMIDVTRRNAARSGLENIEYHLATIDDRLPISTHKFPTCSAATT
jgi:hypothetical protein